MGWVKGEIDGNHDFKAPLNNMICSWLASFFWGSKVWEMLWVKGSVELRKGVRYLVHMMMFAFRMIVFSCIHITRLSSCWSHVCKKQHRSYFNHLSLFLSIYSFQHVPTLPNLPPLFFLQPTNPPTSALPYPTRKLWTDPRLHQERWELHHPKPGGCRWKWRHDDDNILRKTKKKRTPLPPHNVKRKVIFNNWNLFDIGYVVKNTPHSCCITT